MAVVAQFVVEPYPGSRSTAITATAKGLTVGMDSSNHRDTLGGDGSR
jgi:hypothetical protein